MPAERSSVGSAIAAATLPGLVDYEPMLPDLDLVLVALCGGAVGASALLPLEQLGVSLPAYRAIAKARSDVLSRRRSTARASSPAS